MGDFDKINILARGFLENPAIPFDPSDEELFEKVSNSLKYNNVLNDNNS